MAVEYVDVSDIHLRDIRFQIMRADGRLFDFSDLVSEFNWSDHVNTAGAEAQIVATGIVSDVLSVGGEGSLCRVTAPLVDLSSGKLVRRELWQGTFEDVVDHRTTGQIERQITAFDIAKYFANNEEDYVFKNHTLSSIVTAVAKDFEIPIGTIASTSKTLGQIVARGTSLWDLLQEATQRHADQTGEVFYIYAKNGSLNMKLQGDQSRWWVFEAGESLQDLRRTRSTRDVINRVKVYGVFEGEAGKPKVESTKESTKSQGLYGLRQKVEYLGSAEDESKVVDIAQKTLDRYAAPDETLDITGWIVPNLRAGEQIRFIDKDLGLNRLYYVESIDTSWSTTSAETIATVRREAVDPDIILDEVTVA